MTEKSSPSASPKEDPKNEEIAIQPATPADIEAAPKPQKKKRVKTADIKPPRQEKIARQAPKEQKKTEKTARNAKKKEARIRQKTNSQERKNVEKSKITRRIPQKGYWKYFPAVLSDWERRAVMAATVLVAVGLVLSVVGAARAVLEPLPQNGGSYNVCS